MPLLKDGLAPTALRMGDAPVLKAYMGPNQVWPVVAGVTVYWSDSFNRADSTSLGLTDSFRGGSSIALTSTGQFGIVNNRVGNAAFTVNRFLTGETNSQNQCIDTVLTYLGGSITLRYVGSTEYYRVDVLDTGAANIQRRIANASVTIKTIPAGTFAQGDRVSWEIAANVLKLYKNGALVDTTTDGNATIPVGTRAGIASRFSGDWWCDEIICAEKFGNFTAPPPYTGPTRLSTVHPFHESTFSNTAVGSGITFAPKTDQRYIDLQTRSSQFNCARWSVSVVTAKNTDPTVTLNVNNSYTMTLKIPVDAEPGAGTDLHLSVIQPDNTNVVEMWGATRVDDNNWTCYYAITTNLLGTGMSAGARASGISHLHGLIRKEELASGVINHTLALGLDGSQMLPLGPDASGNYGVWPARRQDGHASTAYTGSIPMGTMFAIPASVDINALGLSPGGLMIAKALQDYGAHVLILAATVAIYGEPLAEIQHPTVAAQIRTAWARTVDGGNDLAQYLQPVTNNTSTNVAGGGTRRQPTAYPVIAG